jgi:pimeloyl-ACP methyl ester carboxylesterase
MPRRDIAFDHPPFAALPTDLVTVGRRGETVAVHVAGRLSSERVPVICLAGYTRNMADFADFAPLLQRRLGDDWPVVLIDLRGRGRSADRRGPADYAVPADARDIGEVARALGTERAAFVGQGHGGQVVMALAARRPGLIAAAVLVDAGPASEAQSLIRLRSNHEAIAQQRGASGLTVMLRRMLQAGYPDAPREALDGLAARHVIVDRHGRARPLYDPALIARLKDLAYDDVLVPQWGLFDLLGQVPVMFVRTELTDQLPRALLEQMRQRRPEAPSVEIARQGSPALLDREEEVDPIAEFIAAAVRQDVSRPARRA